MFKTFVKGQVAMLKAQLRATELGMVTALPTTETRYDLLIDDGKKIHRAQVKYVGPSHRRTDAVALDLRKETRGTGKKRTYTRDEIDVVLVYVPTIDSVLWVGPKDFHNKQTLQFRIGPSKSGQKKRLRFAKDFEWK